MSARRAAPFLPLLLSTLALPAHAQCPAGAPVQLAFDDARKELVRAADVLGLTGGTPMFLHREQDRRTVCGDSVAVLDAWLPARDSTMLEILAPAARAVLHTAYPRERNNGGLVETAGIAGSLDFGIAARWRFLRAVLAPRFTYQQNDAFTVPASTFTGRSEWANPDHSGIDLPKRFGTDGWSEAQWGASRLEAVYGPLAAGVSTANMWIGAAQRFPILMSNTAPGFVHGYIGTRRPFDARIADVEFNAFWGEVEESDWFDGDEGNDGHYITGIELAVAPHFLPGFQLGAARIYHDSASFGDVGLGTMLETLIESPIWTSGGNRAGNAIGVLFGRWVLPESGFEVYGEWSREDTPFNLEDAFREPDWTQAYALGFQKLLVGETTLARFYGELVHLGESAPVRAGKGFFSYYTHHIVTQGHTNRGQVLGAAVGPGSDAQLLGFERYGRTSRTHVFVERTRYDDDTYYRTFSRRWGEARHDVELTVGVARLQRIDAIEVEAGLNVSRRYDRDFIPLRDGVGERFIETNWNPWLRVSWRPEMVPPLLP